MIRQKSLTGVSQAIRSTLTSLQNNEPLAEKTKKEAFHIKIANTLEERAEVFHLAYQVYLEKGYIKENPNEWHLSSFDAKQETVIFIVQDHQKKLAGSVTIVFDSSGKLPADKIYHEELGALRIAGLKMIEISRLVISPDFRNSKEILVLLFNYLAIYGYHIKRFDNLIIEVNPRHKEYYKSILCFEEIGLEKPCPQVQNAPAVLLSLPLKRYQAEVYRVHKTATQASEKKDRTLYPYFLKPEQESLVADYLVKQTKAMSNEEKLYFGMAESGFSKAVCV